MPLTMQQPLFQLNTHYQFLPCLKLLRQFPSTSSISPSSLFFDSCLLSHFLLTLPAFISCHVSYLSSSLPPPIDFQFIWEFFRHSPQKLVSKLKAFWNFSSVLILLILFNFHLFEIMYSFFFFVPHFNPRFSSFLSYFLPSTAQPLLHCHLSLAPPFPSPFSFSNFNSANNLSFLWLLRISK